MAFQMNYNKPIQAPKPGLGTQASGAANNMAKAGAISGIAQGVNMLGQAALGATKNTKKDQYGIEQVDEGNMQASGALSGAASGAGMGATIGSFFPGPGTAIGATVGGLAGATLGFMNSSKEAEEQQQAAADQATNMAASNQRQLDQQRSAALLARMGANLRKARY